MILTNVTLKHHRQHACAGVTLVELLVVLAILGVVSGVVGVAAMSRVPVRDTDDVAASVARTRAEALATGRTVTSALVHAGRPATVTAFPDGSVVADTALQLDRLTGRSVVDAP